MKKVLINVVCAFIPVKSWRKKARKILNKSSQYSLFIFIKKTEKHNLLIIDDYFPVPMANTWRSEEFHEYFKRIPNIKCLNIPNCFNNIFMGGIGKVAYNKKLASYLKYKPENKIFISQIDVCKKYNANLAYLLFFNNICLMLPWLEKNNIPFVFCLYPGGGFCPKNKEKDAELKKIFSSPMFREVIVTVPFTEEYLLENRFCQKDKINFIYGGFSQINYNQVLPKKLYKKEKDSFDICFAAHKYSERGLKKGFDIFIEIADKLSKIYLDMHFHVVGNWDDDIKPYLCNQNIHFHSIKPADFFLEFYSRMDIFMTPNRSHKILRNMESYKNNKNIEFDGFPLGLDAGICGTALFATDELDHTKGFFEDGEDIVLINHNPKDIINKIEYYYNNLEELYLLSEKQQIKMIELFNTETQIKQRLNILNKYLKKE